MQKNLDSLSFQVDKNIVEQVYEIYMISFSPDGKQISVVNHVEMKSFPAEGAEVPIHKHPLVKMPYKAAQELLDELWHVG